MTSSSSPNQLDAIKAARDLHREAVDASCFGRHGQALQLTQRGIGLLDRLAPVAPQHHQEWLRTRIRLSSSHAALLSQTAGLAEGLAGLDAIRPLIADLGDSVARAELMAGVDNNYGVLLLNAGRNEESIGWLDSSIQHQENCLSAVDDPRPLVDPFVKTLLSRGLVFTRLGLLRRARADLNRAVELATQHDLPERAADLHRAIGNLELRAGDVPAALRQYEGGYRLYRGLGLEVLAMLRLDQAQALLTAGLAHEAGRHLDDVLPDMRKQGILELAYAEQFRATAALMTGDTELAQRMAAAARRRTRQWGCETCVANANLVSLRADTLRALESGEIQSSLVRRARQYADALPAPKLTDQAAVARMLAARLEIRGGRLDVVGDLLRQVPRPGRLTPIDYRMLRRLCRAELAAAKGDTSRALREIRSGLAELDQVRGRMGGLELLTGTALHGQELSELAIHLVLRSKNPRRLFDWLERTRAQTYRYEPLVGVADPDLAERIAEVRSLTQSVHQAQHDGHPTGALLTRRADRLREANRLGWHAGRWGQPRPVAGLLEVREQLGEQALVSFAVSDDALMAVVVVAGDVRIVQLGAAAAASERARMLNADLNALAPDLLPGALAQVISTSARKQADLIDRQLVRPLASLIGERDLVIVPTGALYAIPWGLLPTLHSRPTVVAPSATAWLAAERASRYAGPTVLVRAPGLPAAVGEIRKLSTHHRTARLISGDEASVAAVVQALDGAKLAHIAAHGAHEPENALFSKLELADGALFAHEMAGLNRPPQHVVLAACELALNRIRPGDEPLGFASALLASGSQTVIAPLSRVGDQASAAAMDDYHRGLAAGAKPAVALADAIAVDPLRRPFVCLGSSR